MERDEVRFSEKLVHGHGLDTQGAELGGRPIWIKADDPKAQANAASGDSAPDSTDANDPQGSPDHAVNRSAGAIGVASRRDGAMEPRDMARRGEDQGDRMLGNVLGPVCRCVAHGHAELGRGSNRDLVVADSPAHDQATVRQRGHHLTGHERLP